MNTQQNLLSPIFGVDPFFRCAQNGWAGWTDMQKTVETTFVVGIRSGRGGSEPTFLYPFESQVSEGDVRKGEDNSMGHPIHQVLKWKQWLAEGIVSNFSQIAEREGLSRARVTQMMKLLKLQPEIQSYLKSLDNLSGLKFFSIRKMLKITEPDSDKQVEAFESLKSRFLGK